MKSESPPDLLLSDIETGPVGKLPFSRTLTFALAANVIVSVLLLVVDFRKTNSNAPAFGPASAALQIQLAHASNEVATLQSRRKQLEADVQSTAARLAQLTKEADDLRQLRQALTRELAAESETRRVLLEQENARVQALKMAAVRATEEGQVAKKALAEIQAAQTRLSAEQNQLETLRLSQLKEVEKACQDLATAQSRLTDTKQQLDKAETDLGTRRKAVQELVERQTSLSNEVRRSDLLLEKNRQAKAALEREIAALQQQKSAAASGETARPDPK